MVLFIYLNIKQNDILTAVTVFASIHSFIHSTVCAIQRPVKRQVIKRRIIIVYQPQL